MEVSWKINAQALRDLCAFYETFVEKPWKNTRLEYGETTESLWTNHGTFVEKQIWRNCGKQHTGKLQTRKNQRRATIKAQALREWSSTRTNRRDGKMFRKIVDWVKTESGKEVLTGVFWGFVGIIAVRLFCFLVCVVTGYPIS